MPTFHVCRLYNNPPEISTDGGIERRQKAVNYRYKFVENPNPENTYEHETDLKLRSRLEDESLQATIHDYTFRTIQTAYLRLGKSLRARIWKAVHRGPPERYTRLRCFLKKNV